MIAYLSGHILHQQDNIYTIQPQWQGIGYNVVVSQSLLSLDAKNISTYIYHHITEQDQKLFWFVDIAEKNLFITLLKVNGVWPKAAMGLLTLWANKLITAIETEDTKMLATAPGIGPKAANKIIVELKGVLPSTTQESVDTSKQYKAFIPVVIESLVQMGYDRNTLNDILDTLPDDINTAESATIWCIRSLSV